MFHGKNEIQSEATYIASFIGDESVAVDIYYLQDEDALAIVHSNEISRNKVLGLDLLKATEHKGNWQRALEAYKSAEQYLQA